ncbi:hypothetical protein NQ314_014964, partial [Rhamnusium bicolor]
SKRPRINVEDCSLEESDSDQEEIKRSRQSSPLTQAPAPLAPTPSPEPVTSPDPDLDVEDETEGEAPENLSIKREKPPSPVTPPHTQHASNFIAYHQQFAQFPSQYQPQCKGDVLQAMELMVNGSHEEVSAPSAFSPLGPPPNFHRYSPSRRFLSAPYAGTGYLPTVIRPPPDYLSLVGPVHDIYKNENTTASSPGSNTGSDKTSYSE